ncbi:cystathionine gamma-lyase [Crossiella cryophila]|uniref:Cystathionine gamma-lyase n=1 Tax=Crossiella cryophila TaxID=43355 RepID=A0A7W7G0D3_9PSEU|nr:cystathionine gamma-lyase [Crossiella cryophila]MBB4682134.1 cystathionine gamma-lyase [Crossiella cryophila]
MNEEWGDGTRCVHAGSVKPVLGQPLVSGPVFASVYHLQDGPAAPAALGNTYGRAENPTWEVLEEAIGALDGGRALVYPSGMAAIAGLLRATLRSGDTVIVPADGYYATRQLVREELGQFGVRMREIATPGPWTPEVFDGVRLVLVETPSNPLLDVCDLIALSDAAHERGAIVAVDNTTATPLGQRPLDLGADVVVASDTKALSGHSDLLLGHVSTNDPELYARLAKGRKLSGAIPGPFETWLAHRGLGTLDLRLARQAQNAEALATALRAHPAITDLRWPGLPGDPAHEIAKRQMTRFGGVLRFTLPDKETVARFIDASELVSATTSFGGLHTTADRRAQWGDAVPEGFVRLSAGCEDTADLVTDIVVALETAVR